jgi:TetR/AcrR family transcriptional regulator, acrAB operon repressor
MVRRTKTEALETRNSLLDAAEHLFQARGVSRTSLNDIATEAGTTRGAIYWHFKDKADLFNAMMERVTMPLECSLANTVQSVAEPLLSLRDAMLSALRQTATDEQTRRVFEVATHKVEYVTEMQAVRDRHLRVRNECMAMTEAALGHAVRRDNIELGMPLSTAALGLHVMLDGLIQNWLLDPQAFDLVRCGRHTMDAYFVGLGFSPADARAPRRAAPVRASPGPGAALPAP